MSMWSFGSAKALLARLGCHHPQAPNRWGSVLAWAGTQAELLKSGHWSSPLHQSTIVYHSLPSHRMSSHSQGTFPSCGYRGHTGGPLRHSAGCFARAFAAPQAQCVFFSRISRTVWLLFILIQHLWISLDPRDSRKSTVEQPTTGTCSTASSEMNQSDLVATRQLVSFLGSWVGNEMYLQNPCSQPMNQHEPD